MLSRDIPLYTLDLTGKNPDNLVTREYYSRTDPKTQKGFVLRHGPFYTQSLVLTRPNGELLVEGEHYEIYGIATALTAFVQDKEVAMLVALIDDTITEWFTTYQVVGHFSVLNQDLINMVQGAIDDDRPVYYKNINNKPLWFNPELHQHDIRYEIHSFQDIIALIKRIKETKDILPNRNKVSMDHFYSVILTHITDYERMLTEYIKKHDSDDTPPFTNSHGLTAKQMQLEKVDNFKTATLIDVLNGYRTDLHVTADNVKQVLDTVLKESDNLVKLGSIPVLRYGSNSFIPTPIQGSFEGMGGTNFYVGLNIESNGDGVMIMNRNDGRVNNLYFMTNTDPKFDVKKWNFTGYQYTHQTADADGVTLRNILRGSDGKFLIVGGPNKANKTVWYYSLGHGTFDPLKHKLITLPTDIVVNGSSQICTEVFPDRVLLFTRYEASQIMKSEYRSVGFDLPFDGTSFEGVGFTSGFMGMQIYEYSVKEDEWREVTLNYNSVGYPAVSSKMWVPYKWVVKEITPDNPRADGKPYKYGLTAFEYKFNKPITSWNMRSWYDTVVGLYDKDKDALYLKYWFTSHGTDDRPNNYEGGTSSIGFILKNRKLDGDTLYYDVENRKSLTQMYTLDTSVLGANSGANIVEGLRYPHSEWIPSGYAGPRSQAWLGKKRFFSMGSSSYGTFPASMTTHDFNGAGSVENLDNFVDGKLNDNLNGITVPGTSVYYNETNAAGLTIGAHSTFWLPLNPNDPTTYGSVSYSNITGEGSYGLWYRQHPVLDSQGYPVPPTKHYKLYDALDGRGKDTLGYGLNNTVYPILNYPETCFVTNVFYNATNNRKSEYQKHLVGHSPYPGRSRSVNNSTAVTQVSTEWEVVAQDKGYIIEPTKTYDLDNQIKNVLIPYMTERMTTAISRPVKLSAENALATYRIGFTNLRSNKYENLLIISFLVFDDDDDNNTYTYCGNLSMAFNLTGGKAGNDGIITGATVTPVGNVVGTRFTSVRGDRIKTYARAGANFNRSLSTTITQSRDLVHQYENGLSHVNMQWDCYVEVKGNNNYPGMSYLVSEDGIIDALAFSVYWTAGEYVFFHHPYYGLVNRNNGNRSSGPSEVGYSYASNIDKLNQLTFSTAANWVMATSNYLEAAFTIYINSDQDVLLNGREYSLKSTIIDLKSITPDPAGKLFYIYLDYGNSGPYYRVISTPLTESPSRALISVVRTNDDGIYTIENYNVFSMNGYRISTVRHGSVIPAATGSIDENGQLNGWISS